jgi:Sulfatase
VTDAITLEPGRRRAVPSSAASWATILVALVTLNVPVALGNLWPTPFPRPTFDLSAELALAALGLGALGASLVGRRRLLTRWLAALWVLLTFGRYAAATSQSLWGRDINLYWDMPHLPAVGAMLAYVVDPRVVAGLVTGIVLIPLLLYFPFRWAFGQLVDALAETARRRALRGLAVVVLVFGIGQRLSEHVPQNPAVVEPVTLAWARQAAQLVRETRGAGAQALPPAPTIDSALRRLAGADVFLIFVESYGAVSWDRTSFAEGLASGRTRLETAIRETGRGVVSAFVESPTFGGESWLAHLSLLSGTEIRDGSTNVRLLAQRRDTFVTAFSRAGYRTLAIMPGLQRAWAEGAFYGFDQVYDASRLAYGGPSFGWWDVNDQYALARVDLLEVSAPDRRPVLVVFPTISTHTPFTPTPPYQSDWTKVLTLDPYEPEALDEAYGVPADWLDLAPGYVRALTYDLDVLAGYLRQRAGRDLVMIVIGDHQPPAVVSGEGAPWDVPVHVIADRADVLDQLAARGFGRGLRPRRPVLSKMHELMPVFLDAFDRTP